MITSAHTRGAAAEAEAIGAQFGPSTRDYVVLASDTTALGCWCVRVEGFARLTQTW